MGNLKISKKKNVKLCTWKCKKKLQNYEPENVKKKLHDIFVHCQDVMKFSLSKILWVFVALNICLLRFYQIILFVSIADLHILWHIYSLVLTV